MLDAHDISLLEELRLRRWARLNYRSNPERMTLHSVVRDELLAMDQEFVFADPALQETQRENRKDRTEAMWTTARFVPLADKPMLCRPLNGDYAESVTALPGDLTEGPLSSAASGSATGRIRVDTQPGEPAGPAFQRLTSKRVTSRFAEALPPAL